jgi:hypothetical protein
MSFTLSLDASAGMVKRTGNDQDEASPQETMEDSSVVKATQRNVVSAPFSDAKFNDYDALPLSLHSSSSSSSDRSLSRCPSCCPCQYPVWHGR